MKNTIKSVLVIFFIALTVRAIYFIGMQNSNIIQAINSTLDSRFYDTWAQKIINEGWIGREVFFMNPGYPYFMAILYSLFGTAVNTVLLVQFLIGSLSCVLVYLIAKKVFNPSVAFISGIIASFYGISIFYEGLLVTASIITFINLIIIYLLLNLDFTDKILRAKPFLFITGILLGISALIRPNILLFAVLIPIYIVWKSKTYSNRPLLFALKFIAIFLVGIFLSIFPVTLRNYVVSREFVITTSGAGMNFYMGNNPQANGSYKVLAFARSDPRYEGEDFRKEASRITGRDLTLSESSKFWFGNLWNTLRRNR